MFALQMPIESQVLPDTAGTRERKSELCDRGGYKRAPWWETQTSQDHPHKCKVPTMMGAVRRQLQK